ncbi:MAG: hypothetical protein WBY53_06370 [Acidobacteriaceae bacterium]
MTRNPPSLLALAVLTLLSAPLAIAQQASTPDQQQPFTQASHKSFFASYEARVLAEEAKQPHWATPLITTNARIQQGFRADFLRQTTPTGATTWNLGNTKGIQTIPFPRTEIRISPPPFFEHSAPQSSQAAPPNGFGDIAFRIKYRLYGSNEQHHNAILTAEFSATIPTGKSGNGSCCAILTPAIGLGKGFRNVAWQTTFGAVLPASNTKGLGRSLTWNNAMEYHATPILWIQDEFNSTFYLGGKNAGKQQTFNTPGIIISRIPLTFGNRLRGRPNHPKPLAISLGAGEQIALTHFNTYNHSPVFTARLRF